MDYQILLIYSLQAISKKKKKEEDDVKLKYVQ